MASYKRLLLVLLLSLHGWAAYGQDSVAARLMTLHAPTWLDIQYNCTVLIPKLHAEHRTDTIDMLMGYWKRNSNYDNYLWYAYKILSSIEQRTFSEGIYQDRNIVSVLWSFGRFVNDTSGSSHQMGYYVITPGDRSFAVFIQALASDLKKMQGLSELEKFLVDFYAQPDNEKLKHLEVAGLKGTQLEKQIGKERQSYDSRVGLAFAILGGVWKPTGNLEQLGNHPLIGVQIGGSLSKYELVLTLAGMTNNSSNQHLVRVDDSMFVTNQFWGGYIGLDGAYPLFKRKATNNIELLGGLAYDYITLLRIPESGNPTQFEKEIRTANVNFGLGYRFWYKKWPYICVQAKYNLVSYRNNNGGTDLSGNSITLNLIVGGVLNSKGRPFYMY